MLEATPDNDPGKRAVLSAYARYRIMLIHTFKRELDQARTDYNTLMTMYPRGTDGHPYGQVAGIFWQAYEVHNDLVSACHATVDYASAHREVKVALPYQ